MGPPKRCFNDFSEACLDFCSCLSLGFGVSILENWQWVRVWLTQGWEFLGSSVESVIVPECHFWSNQTFLSCRRRTVPSIFIVYVELPRILVWDSVKSILVIKVHHSPSEIICQICSTVSHYRKVDLESSCCLFIVEAPRTKLSTLPKLFVGMKMLSSHFSSTFNW